MPNSTPTPSPSTSSKAGSLPVITGLSCGILFFIVFGWISFRNASFLYDDAQQVAHTHQVIVSLGNILSLMKDAETGQRGFLLTNSSTYLAPFNAAHADIDEAMTLTQDLTRDNPIQQGLIQQLKGHVGAKFAELQETIELRKTKGFEAAVAVVANDRGKSDMDAIREKVSTMISEELRLRKERQAAMLDAYHVAVASAVVTSVLGVGLITVVAFLIHRATATRRRQDWLQRGKLGLATAMFGEQNLSQLGQSILGFLTKYVDAHVGVLFSKEDEHFRRIASYGVPANALVPDGFIKDDGLLAQAVSKKTALRIKEIPEGYITFGSALGKSLPRELIIVPSNSDGEVNAVLELGFIHPLDNATQDFLQESSAQIAVAIKSAHYRDNLQSLLLETQRQGEELQTQSEELRVSNEELEEQSRALQESQTRMELQQVEMEQTNAQLEEQTQLLEHQRDELNHSKGVLETQAKLVEQASRYKSDFLANMSHELRTPLNSSLILAKLLAENRGGNLTAEQIQYALTIESAGNDLLLLINDVLDLSKIEAGHMEIKSAPIRVMDLMGDLRRTFEPIAQQKGLTLQMETSADLPETIETDSQRLVQVLKNLISNALKFTERGGVTLSVRNEAGNKLAFMVQDTGIGIADEHQRIIFEPFQQADGTTNRKYGGTGLGLSISRELVRLLGGEIRLSSEVGRGSTFTVVTPVIHQGPAAEISRTATTAEAPRQATSQASEPPASVAAPLIPDDRETITSSSRIILTVEDDAGFAQIMADIVHEMGFQCLVAGSANEALRLAQKFVPRAIVLDIGLPDNTGLFVLERLKADARTRHIPVHVVSGADYAQTALSLGAVGYMLKPVKREELVDAFQKMESRFTQKMRRVLVVEDDAVQADAVQKLLGSREVETVWAGSAAECLELLRSTTFDCMVLDLSLPDASGYSLLQTLSAEERYSFPPVIVYTGRDLSSQEEQQLRRYSKSIIIKGAKSPERLLDEVTLFLHQVVADLPVEKQKILEKSPNRDAALEGRRILVAEDDVRNIFALTSLLEGRGVKLQITRNGREAIQALETDGPNIDLVLMDIMMPEMDGITAMREIRKRPEWKKMPIIALTAKAMKDDQEKCLAAGANDYLAKPLDVEKLLSLIRVWMPR
ncbi:response regulator [Brevifollis gellanilyticus]|uniref:histidine kinase n=1 Tax=Brevifollis gellanilyticus TaxID=748831 RepID=A0A512MBX5_9BACT|nr:response regulator [Brevifollis gellanilyticus]GEP44236.1 two-component system sensor histidine kinase/response regulator [Brevifollis gellanilyticus]